MGDKKKQLTFLKFGFSEKIPHRNELQDVHVRSFVKDDDVSLYHCDTCNKHFKTKSGLTMHMCWCTSQKVSEREKELPTKKINENPLTLESSAEAVEPQRESTIIDVDENIEETVEECQEIETSARGSETGESNRHHREKNNKLSYDTEFKLKVIQEAKRNQKNDVVFKYHISKWMVSSWVQNEQKITDAAANSSREMMKKITPSKRHKQVFVKLHEKFLEARSKGMRISFAWLFANARKINATLGPGLDKWQCTLQICFAAEGPPVKIVIIFRGTAKRISQVEIQAYHKNVDVYWQTNA
eukprot:gene11559-12751_t